MRNRKRLYLAGLVAVLALAIIGGGAGIAIGQGVGGDDQPIPDAALDTCTAAALADYPGGTVIETEAGDDGAAYSVEIRDSGSQFEVHLDENCNVIGREADDDGPNDQDGQNDD